MNGGPVYAMVVFSIFIRGPRWTSVLKALTSYIGHSNTVFNIYRGAFMTEWFKVVDFWLQT
jgi:hypothetical protein